MPYPRPLQFRQFPGERGRDIVVEGLLLAAQTAGRDDRPGKVLQRRVPIDSHLLGDFERVCQVLRDVLLPANEEFDAHAHRNDLTAEPSGKFRDDLDPAGVQVAPGRDWQGPRRGQYSASADRRVAGCSRMRRERPAMSAGMCSSQDLPSTWPYETARTRPGGPHLAGCGASGSRSIRRARAQALVHAPAALRRRGVFVASPEHLLAMKALAARPRDAEDIRQLVQVLGLHTVDEVLASVREIFPEEAPPARLRLLLEDIFPVQDG